MLIPPRYHLTSQISKLLSSIESSKEIVESFDLPFETEANIRRRAVLKSSLFSARIEGNPLKFEDLAKISPKDKKKLEISNILKTFTFIRHHPSKKFTLSFLSKLHKSVLSNLGPNLGQFREEPNAIFDSGGNVIYLSPPPAQIPLLLRLLLNYLNSSQESLVPIKACLAHYIFEKIHPFLDGNGRVGRLLLQAVLEKEGYGLKGLASLEEYLDQNRPLYYQSLETPPKDVTSYLLFMLEALAVSANQAKDAVLAKRKTNLQDSLLPRREEILNIVEDHHLVNFDFLRRRFLAVNERTLRYDIKKLVDLGLIKKRGATKGVFYESLLNRHIPFCESPSPKEEKY